jgi:hypothetical protein
MKNEIKAIEENKDGRVFTISQVSTGESQLSPELIDHLVAQGMDREQAERMTPARTSIRIMRAQYLETDVPVSDDTKAMIDKIKNQQ